MAILYASDIEILFISSYVLKGFSLPSSSSSLVLAEVSSSELFCLTLTPLLPRCSTLTISMSDPEVSRSSCTLLFSTRSLMSMFSSPKSSSFTSIVFPSENVSPSLPQLRSNVNSYTKREERLYYVLKIVL